MKTKILDSLPLGKHKSPGQVAKALGADPYAVRMAMEEMHRASDLTKRFDGTYRKNVFLCCDCGETDKAKFPDGKHQIRCTACRNADQRARNNRDGAKRRAKREFEL